MANPAAEFLGASWNRGWLPAFLLIVATFLAYQPVWHAGFIWDDEIMLTQNPVIHAPDGLRLIWLSTRLPDCFPMTSTALWIEWRLWGEHPLGYHLVNVVLHALSATLWWRVLARLKIPGAWLAAAMFALHPVNVESVAWITEHKNTLAMFFYSVTALAYVRFEQNGGRRWYAVALSSFILALLSKTAVAPFPLVLLGLAWWQRSTIQLRDVWRSVPFFAASAALAVVTMWFQHHRAIASFVVREDNLPSRLAVAGKALWFYLYKAVLPIDLSFIYPRWPIGSTNLLSFLPGLLAAGGLLMFWWNRRGWGKAWLCGMGYFVVMLLPVLGFINISFMRYSFVADRWQYFAVLGPLTLAAAGVMIFFRRWGIANALPTAGRRYSPAAAGIGAATLLLFALGFLTWRQSGTFTDLETLWRTTLVRNPNSAMAHTDLANVLIQKGQPDEAMEHYRKALELEPDYELANYNFGYALLQKGELDKAIALLENALKARPDSVLAHYHIGNALLQKGQVDAAVFHFRKALDIDPKYPEIQNSLGDVLLRTGDVDGAAIHFEKALQLQPAFPNALSNLGIALFLKGRDSEAIAHFNRALEIQPEFSEARVNLGKALVQMGRGQEAATQYRLALKTHSEDIETSSNLAWLLATWLDASVRNGTEAVELAEKAYRLSNGADPMILRTLAAAQAEVGRFSEAAATVTVALKRVGSASPQFAEVLRSDLKLYEVGQPMRETVQRPPPAR